MQLSRAPSRCTVLWTIAGFDPSSGAGITADLLTMAAHGLFGCSAITALTIQSTQGVFGWQPVDASLLTQTLLRLEDDLPFAGVKIGMLGTPENAQVIGAYLKEARRTDPARKAVVVFDPVLRSSSGRALFPPDALEELHRGLLPHVTWITPNWAELALLGSKPVRDMEEACAAARQLIERHPGLHIVATGGDQQQPDDLLVSPDGSLQHFRGQHVETTSTHGTGCAFSTALLCALTSGAEPAAAVQHAKEYVLGALRAAPGLGRGKGPLGLLWPLQQSARDRGERGC